MSPRAATSRPSTRSRAPFGRGLIHTSHDPDHHRAVFTLRGAPGALADAWSRARARRSRGSTSTATRRAPARGSDRRRADRVPRRGAARRRDRRGADAGRPARPRARPPRLPLRRARGRPHACGPAPRWPATLQRRIESGELAPHAGPTRLHPTAGAVLVAARPPLVAFNLELDAPLEHAKHVAATIREGGAEGLPGVRALGLHLPDQDVVQVSTNIEDLTRTTPADVVRAVQRHAPVTRRRAHRARARGGVRRLPGGRPAAWSTAPVGDTLSDHGPDEAQAPQQASRERRGSRRVARAHRSPADRGGAAQGHAPELARGAAQPRRRRGRARS